MTTTELMRKDVVNVIKIRQIVSKRASKATEKTFQRNKNKGILLRFHRKILGK